MPAVQGRGRRRSTTDGEAYLEALRGEDGMEEWVEVSALDVLMLRNDPSISASEHPWTQTWG